MKKYIASATLYALPFMAAAQNVDSLITKVQGWVNSLTPLIVALALLAFFWGLAKFIFSGAAEDQTQGKNIMIWGIIALFVMVSVWGIVRAIGDTLDIEQGGGIEVPIVPGNN